jgi:IS30 family transposase
MFDDTTKLVATYKACQKFSHRYKALTQPSQLIAPSWPLQWWDIDNVGKLTPAQENYTFAIVIIEYFTKWVEAKLVTNIVSATIQKIFWQNIICRYRVSQQINIDNAKYFDSAMFKDFCHQVRMNVSFASVYHPQSNGAVERANAMIFDAIKKILKGKKKGKWAEVMPRAVWSHNTTIYRATNFTPF